MSAILLKQDIRTKDFVEMGDDSGDMSPESSPISTKSFVLMSCLSNIADIVILIYGTAKWNVIDEKYDNFYFRSNVSQLHRLHSQHLSFQERTTIEILRYLNEREKNVENSVGSNMLLPTLFSTFFSLSFRYRSISIVVLS